MGCQDSLLPSNMSLMLHIVVFWEQRKGWRRGKTSGTECGMALWQQQILELLSLGAVTAVTQPIGTSTALTLHFHGSLLIFKKMSPYSKESLLLIKKIKVPNLPLDFACYPQPAQEPLGEWLTVTIAHSSPLQLSDEAELRPQLQNTVWCWWCGDVVPIMNSIRACVKMHGVQHHIPSALSSQQLCAADSLPFALEGPLTLSVPVSSWLPLQWRCGRRRMQPGAVQTQGRVSRRRMETTLCGGEGVCVLSSDRWREAQEGFGGRQQ